MNSYLDWFDKETLEWLDPEGSEDFWTAYLAVQDDIKNGRTDRMIWRQIADMACLVSTEFQDAIYCFLMENYNNDERN